ncbi:transcriptional adapter ADA2b-like, partial [Carica papaya]|uniref:transcriptional adapter ADA2b-like n=1 Tax=Carica papaya TaxID=3649 RepID=UPI000B8CCFFB
MGRSRGNFRSDEDPTQRSRRKKNATIGENSESASAGQGSSEVKRALYHCNYCNKDITGKIRVKCAVCTDFDLCAECFSVGAEVTPHKCNHPYKIMDDLSFPLLCPDWSADDEMLLLEGIDMYGLNDWAEVAEHVGTKSKESCSEHYTSVYLNSPYFPLPDMSRVGKTRKELLDMAEGHSEDNKDPQTDRNFGGKKPSSMGNDNLIELSGYNPKRQEFDPEYDHDAEQLLAEMEFNDTDTEEERELKIRVLRAYSRRLDERQRRKDFILQRDLLYANPFEKDLSPEEIAICRSYDPFMRFHSKEEHEELLRTSVEQHRTLKRIQELKEAKAAGCRTSAEADRYLEQRRKRDSAESSRRAKESTEVGTGVQGGPNAFIASESVGKDSNCRPSGQTSSSHHNDLD